MYSISDPTNLIDPTGEAPAALIPTDPQQIDRALIYGELAKAGYKSRTLALPGWRLLKGGVHNNRVTGFHAKGFQNIATGEIVLSFGGTDGQNDLVPDALQGAGIDSAQYLSAIRLAGVYKAKYGNKLTLTGHSLGGGLATAAAITHSIPAWTFNPASVHPDTVGGIRNLRKARQFVNAFFLEGEFLHLGEGLMGSANFYYGKTFVIPDVLKTNVLNGHFMDNVIVLPQSEVEFSWVSVSIT